MDATDRLMAIEAVLADRLAAEPSASYVASLYAKGTNKILEKVGEEATEFILAAKDGNPANVVAECADLIFHSMVLLTYQGLSVMDVINELERRSGVSGLDEKASRKT